MIDPDIYASAEQANSECPDCGHPNHWEEPGDSRLCHECEKENA